MEDKKITRENITSHLLEYQLNMIGKDLTCLIDDDMWRYNNIFKGSQYLEFKGYAVKLMMKTFRFTKNKANETFDWYWQRFGIRIKN
jgi:hypothetical protein